MTLLSPHIQRIHLRAGLLTAALLMLCVATVLWPAQALAAGGFGRCMDSASYQALAGAHGFFADDNEIDAQRLQELLVSDLAESEPAAPVARPCAGVADGEPGEADASSNLCFADVSEPISTLPRLIAQWRGEQEAAEVVDSFLRALNLGAEPLADADLSEDPGTSDALARLHEPTPASSSQDSLQRALPRPQPADPSLSCSTAADACHALPPLLQLPDFSGAVSLIPAHPGFHVPEIEILAQPPAWIAPLQGPRAGHTRLPDKPPRLHAAARLTV